MSSMSLMAEATRANYHDDPLYGIELEAEDAGEVGPAYGWFITTDGSLRNNGREFVFDGPCDYDAAVDRIETLASAIKQASRAPLHNPRTSVHIHVDVTWMTPEQFRMFVINWACVEPALFSKYGSGREYSPYCVPLHQGRTYLYHLLLASEQCRDDAEMMLRDYKYTALSCNRFNDLGTMEARLFNGTNSADTMIEYLSVLDKLVRGSGVADVLEYMGSLDYLEQAVDLMELIHFERSTPREILNPHALKLQGPVAALYSRAIGYKIGRTNRPALADILGSTPIFNMDAVLEDIELEDED